MESRWAVPIVTTLGLTGDRQEKLGKKPPAHGTGLKFIIALLPLKKRGVWGRAGPCERRSRALKALGRMLI